MKQKNNDLRDELSRLETDQKDNKEAIKVFIMLVGFVVSVPAIVAISLLLFMFVGMSSRITRPDVVIGILVALLIFVITLPFISYAINLWRIRRIKSRLGEKDKR